MKYLIFSLGLIWCFACTPPPVETQEEDAILAKVYNQSLYLSELDGMFPAGSTKEDSLLLLNSMVEQWVRDRLLLHEAELNIPNDVNIDKLVRDYRSTLVLHNYEQQLLAIELDSTITEEEIEAFYEKNKDEYQIKNPIIRCRFIKVPLSAIGVEDIELWWKSDAEIDEVQLVNYCNKNAEVYYLNELKWFDIEQIIKHLPKGILTNASVNVKKDYRHQDLNYLYLVKILEVVSNNQPLPIGYIENRAKKVILHKRKIKLLEEKKASLYENAINNTNVQIY